MIRRLLKNVFGENFTENNAKLATVNFGVILQKSSLRKRILMGS